MEALVVILIITAVDVAALRWGSDSSPRIDERGSHRAI